MGKFDTFYKYPHLETLYNVKAISLIREIVVSEKIHGTNARLGWCQGEFVVGTRNEQAFLKDVGDNYCMGFAGWLREQKMEERLDHLKHMEVAIYGEFYGEGVQKGIFYRKGKHFRAFMARIHEFVLEWEKLEKFLTENSIDCVPVFFKGAWDTTDSLETFLLKFYDTESRVPAEDGFVDDTPEDNIIEGVVVVPIIPLKTREGEWLIAKFKNNKWKEKLEVTKSMLHPLTRLESQTAMQFTTKPRLINVLGHMETEGYDIHTMKSLGEVIKRMNKDVLQEPEIQTLVDEDKEEHISWKKTSKEVSKLTRDLYEEHLKDSFV